MATRLYPSQTTKSDIPPIFPAFEAGWSETDGARRVMMRDRVINTSNGLGLVMDGAPNTSQLNTQAISFPMQTGTIFLGTDTISGVIYCAENAAEDNIDRTPFCLKVMSFDGGTVRAILKALGYYGTSSDELSTALTSRVLADNIQLDTGYTTVDGDRLVFEFGLQVSAGGGTTPSGQVTLFAHSNFTDFPKVNGLLGGRNTWLELSTDIVFLLPSEESVVLFTPIWANKHRIVA